MIDADLQHPPELLRQMYGKILEGYDVVVASRYTRGGSVKGLTLPRKMISIGGTALAHLFLPKTREVKDVLSGFFMIKREVLGKVNLRPVGYKILLEVLVRGNYASVHEVPYHFEHRKNEKSNFSPKVVVDYLGHLSRLVCCRSAATKDAET